VIVCLRELLSLSLSLSAARELLARLPVIVARNLAASDALAMARTLVERGARATVPGIRDSKEVVPPPSLPEVEELDPAGLLAALAAGAARTRDEEIDLRLSVWRDANDRFRQGEPWVPYRERPEERANLERLVEILPSGDPNERMLKADALRQLERFAEAEPLLEGLRDVPAMELRFRIAQRMSALGLLVQYSRPRY
jgi:hypothetical protein